MMKGYKFSLSSHNRGYKNWYEISNDRMLFLILVKSKLKDQKLSQKRFTMTEILI